MNQMFFAEFILNGSILHLYNDMQTQDCITTRSKYDHGLTAVAVEDVCVSSKISSLLPKCLMIVLI